MTHRDLRILLAACSWWAATIIALLYGTGIVVTVVVAVAGAVFFAGHILRPFGRGRSIRYWTPTLTVLAVAALLAALATSSHDRLAGRGILADLADDRAVAVIEGTITSYPNPSGDRVLRTLRVSHVEGRGATSRSYSTVMLVGDDSLVAPDLGQKISVSVRLDRADRGARHAAWATTLGPVTVTDEAGPLSRWIAGRGRELARLLEEEAPQIQGLVPGLAIGDDSLIPDAHGEALAAVNLTHLTAVSGSHVSMICGIALALVGRRRRLLAVGAAGGVLAALVIATGAQPSVLRAGVMGAVVLGAVWMRRPSSALPALGVSVIVLVGMEPGLALAYGFILSVVSTAAIISWARPAASVLAPVISVPVANLLAVPIVAHVACAPVILLLSDTASIWSALANALVAPVVPAGTIFALSGLILSGVPIAGPVLVWLAARCVSWIDIVATELSSWPGSGVDGRLVMAGYLGIILASWLIATGRARRRWVAAAALGLAGARILPGSAPEWDIVQCDVGQGSATLVRAGGLTYLVDTGLPTSRLMACLTEARAEIDILVITHFHADHMGLATEVSKRGVQEIWVGPGMTGQARDLAMAAPIREVAAGKTINGVDVLWPESAVACWTDSCINNQSVVVRFDIGQTVLITGDLETEAQRRLAQTDIRADIALIPHHGSARQDEAFANAVGATTALLSYGENTYGHPAPATVDLYAQFGTVLDTTNGDIYLRIDNPK